MNNRIGLLGAGAQAREIASYLPVNAEVFWAVSRDYVDVNEDRQIDIREPSLADRETCVVGAVGAPGLRRRLVEVWPGNKFATIVSTAAYVDASCKIGAGTVIAPGAVLTVGVVVGEHSQVNVGATLSHDVQLGSFVTVCPGANISGGVTLGDGVFVGAGATVIGAIKIASGVVIGAGATVLNDVSTCNAVVVGVPAATAKVMKDWLDAI